MVCDRLSSRPMVTGDHLDRDSRGVAGANCIDGLCPRWIEHGLKTEKVQGNLSERLHGQDEILFHLTRGERHDAESSRAQLVGRAQHEILVRAIS